MTINSPENGGKFSRLLRRRPAVVEQTRAGLQRPALSEALSAATGMNQTVVDILRLLNDVQDGKHVSASNINVNGTLSRMWAADFQQDIKGLMLLHTFGVGDIPDLVVHEETIPVNYIRIEAQQDAEGKVTSRVALNDPHNKEDDVFARLDLPENKVWLPQVRAHVAVDATVSYERRNSASPRYVGVGYTEHNFDEVLGALADTAYVATVCDSVRI